MNEATPPMWRAILSRRMLICVFIGFSSGMPYYYLVELVPAWLEDAHHLELKTIGAFGLVTLPYAWKVLWAPLLDRYVLPLGRRRGWMFATQLCLIVSMMLVGQTDPGVSIWPAAILATGVGFFSATQDIAIDAYRRELLADRELGLGNAIHINLWRGAGFVPGGLGLILAQYTSWGMAHFVVALFMVPGIIVTLLVTEPNERVRIPVSIGKAIVQPFAEFFGQRKGGLRAALLILAFMLLYKLGDNLATSLATPFYLQLGFSPAELGTIKKVVGFWAMIVGGLVGGIAMLKLGINRSLWVFGVVQMVSILGFAVLNEVGPSRWLLAVVHGSEYFGVGLGTAAFAAFMASQTNQNFTATQLSLFTSFMALPRALSGFISGILIEGSELLGFAGLGFTRFFIACAFLAIPGMTLLWWVAPWNGDARTAADDGETPS